MGSPAPACDALCSRGSNAGAALDVLDADDDTALSLAVTYAHPACVRALVLRHASLARLSAEQLRSVVRLLAQACEEVSACSESWEVWGAAARLPTLAVRLPSAMPLSGTLPTLCRRRRAWSEARMHSAHQHSGAQRQTPACAAPPLLPLHTACVRAFTHCAGRQWPALLGALAQRTPIVAGGLRAATEAFVENGRGALVEKNRHTGRGRGGWGQRGAIRCGMERPPEKWRVRREGSH